MNYITYRELSEPRNFIMVCHWSLSIYGVVPLSPVWICSLNQSLLHVDTTFAWHVLESTGTVMTCASVQCIRTKSTRDLALHQYFHF